MMNVPTHAAAIVAPPRAHRCSTCVASRTSGLPRDACSASGILNPIAGTMTHSGTARGTGRTGP